MKKFLAGILTLCIPFLALILGCPAVKTTSDDNDSFAAKEIADSVIDLTSQLKENSNLIDLSQDAMKSVPQSKDVTLVLITGGLQSFTWTPSNDDYERSGVSGTITIGDYISGTISGLSATFKFFTTLDATGTGQQLFNGKWIDPTNDSAIKSLINTRNYSASLTNSITGITKTINVDADYTVTGINDTTPGVIVNGTRTVNATATGGKWIGAWTITSDFSNVTITRSGTWPNIIYTYNGTVTYTISGTYTGPNGTKVINKTATYTFNGSRIVTVTIDGNTVTINIDTGTIS